MRRILEDLRMEETPAVDPARPAPQGDGRRIDLPQGDHHRPPALLSSAALRQGLGVSSASGFESLVLEASWGVLGRLGDVLGTSWGRLGTSWVRLGASGVRLGGVLGRLGDVLGRISLPI